MDHCEITWFVVVLILHVNATEEEKKECEEEFDELTVISLCISIKRWALGSTFFIGLLRI